MNQLFLTPSVFLALTALSSSGCDVVGLVGGKQASRSVQHAMPLPTSGECEVRTRNGRINCVAGNVSEIIIKAEIKASATSLARAQQEAKRITVERTDDDGVANIKATVPRGTHGSVSLTLIVPAQLNLDLKTTNGAINVVDITGSIEAESTNGRVAVIGNTMSAINAETTNGSIHLKGSLQPGEHDLETTNGSIQIDLVGAPVTVEASTRNGRITANGQRLERGTSVTLGRRGDEAAARLMAETTNGSIRITHGTTAEAASPEPTTLQQL